MKVSINTAHDKLERTRKALKALPTLWDRDEVMMKVFKKSARPMLVAGKASAASSVPKVAAGFHWGARKSKAGDIMRVGVINKAGTTSRLAYLFEAGASNKGTENRTTRTGQNRGVISAHRYWEKAVSSTENKVIEIINKNVDIEVSKHMDKYGL